MTLMYTSACVWQVMWFARAASTGTTAGTGGSGFVLEVRGSLSFEGYLDYTISVVSAQTAAKTTAASAAKFPGLLIEATLRAQHLSGLGRAGRKLGAQAWPLANVPMTGPAPSGCDKNNSLPLTYAVPAAVAPPPMLWVGDVNGGLRIKWKGAGSEWDSPAYRGSSSWGKSSTRINVVNVSTASSSESDSEVAGPPLVSILTTVGPTLDLPVAAADGIPISFHLDMCVTPFKARAEAADEHWQSRYFQVGYPDHHMYTPDEVAETGATIATIHQGVNSMINPYINWPFAKESVAIQSNFSREFSALTNSNHTIPNRFKLYYTARELTNHVAELFPLRSLNGEIIEAVGVTAEQAATRTLRGSPNSRAASGATAWLLEHLVDGFGPCWQQNLAK